MAPGRAVAQAEPSDDILAREVRGPLRITVLASPREPTVGRGGPRFTVEVVDAASGAPVNDADVVIAVDRPDGTSAGEIAVARNPAVPGIYETRVSLPKQHGVWQWAVAVSGAWGTEVVEGSINVLPSPGSGTKGSIGWLALMSAIFIIFFLAWRSLRPAKATPVKPV